MSAQQKLLIKIGVDLAVVLGLAFALLCVKLWAEPYHRGFFVDDTSIRLPYKTNTVSSVLLTILGFALHIGTVVTIEFLRDYRGKSIGTKYVYGKKVPGWVWESYITLGSLVFGCICQQLTTNVGKSVIGRLRPHFYDICQPVFDLSAPLNTMGYIQDYQCTGQNSTLFQESRLSFPSGHSSFAMYIAIFFILYIHLKGKWGGSKLTRHFLQFGALLGAWYVGLSRVTDHMHHWGDVAVGFGIGGAYAFLVFFYVLKPIKYGIPASWSGPQEQNGGPLPR